MKTTKKICGIIIKHTPPYFRGTLVNSARFLFHNKIKKKGFIIITQARSGSSLLIDLLNSHPEITAYNSIFNKNFATHIKQPFRFVQGIFMLSNTPICGFKVRLKEIKRLDIKPSHFIRLFYENDWKIIHLIRKNCIRKTISNLILERTGIEKMLKTTQQEKIKIDISKVLKYVEAQKLALKEETRLLKDIKHHKIYYEESLLKQEDQQEALDSLFDFLNLKPHHVKTRMKKQGKKNLKDYILNYDELKNTLKNTKYHKMLTSK